MRRAIRRSVEVFTRSFDPVDPIVELGARYLPGYAWLGDLRALFPGRAYTGCDIREGDGVDRIEDAQALTFEDASVGTLLMFEVLEHVPRPERALAEVRRVLRDDGLFVMSVPFTYRLHGFPHDYRRLTASGVHQWLEDFGGKTVFALGPRLKPAFVFAVASPSASPKFEERTRRFREQVIRTFKATRLRGYTSALKERGRDLLGCLLGRAEFGAAFFEPGVEDERGSE